MAGITEIRTRMQSVQQTLKITNAMYLISSAKVKKARKQLADVEPYFDKLAKTVLDIFRHSPDLKHRFIEGSPGRIARPGLSWSPATKAWPVPITTMCCGWQKPIWPGKRTPPCS